MKKHKTFLACTLALMVFTTYVIMDTFFITRVYGEVTDGISSEQGDSQTDGNSDNIDDNNNNGSSQADQFDSEDQDGAGNKHDGSSGNGHSKGDKSGNHGPGKGGKPGHRGSGSGGKGKPGHSGSSDSNEGSSDNGGSGSSKGELSDGSVSSQDSSNSSASDSSKSSSSSAVVTSDSYKDDNISITLKEIRQNDTTIYAADVQVSSPEYLKTALAQGAYGRNVTEKTSEMAENADAILAINGDFYGAQEKGYVLRNGELYRDTALEGQEDLVIYKDGSFGIINESDVTAQDLLNAGAQQVLSFGPALIINGQLAVTENEEVGKATASNPRTAIGIIDENHYLIVVSDGRTDDSEGLSLYELAQFMKSQGATTAYNLDGGGSSTMVFNGNIVNNPTGGRGSNERSVSDIVYIGK